MQKQYMIAVCDILGFSHLVQMSPLQNVVNDSFGWLRKSLHHSLHKRDFPNEIPKKSDFLGNKHVGIAWFSDTFLLYSRRDDKEAIHQLIQTVGWLLFETMMAGRMIRGGISFGEAYIDEEESVFVGKPIVEAYQLEKSQQWAGVALTEKAVERIPERVRLGVFDDWWVVPYDVPLKEDKTLQTLAVNWTWGGHSWWRVSWSESKKLPDESDWVARPDVCAKFVNTKAFHKAVCRNCIDDEQE
jgi:hypothetical protein